MKKRMLPILLSLALAASLLPAAFAANAASTEDMAQVLAALDIMTGNEQGDLMLSRRVTRAEFTKLVIAASPLGDSVGSATAVSPYPDVPYTHWAAPYVEAAVAVGYVNGYLDGTFHPDEEITLAMGVSMAVRLLGYADSDFSGAWPAGQMALYRSQDLDKGISLDQNSPMTRRDALYLFYNLLTAQTKAGQIYLALLGHALTPTGEIDRVGLINSAMEGPTVMAAGWQSKVNFDVNTATVYRGGKLSSLGALQSGDVLYWSKSMRTVWAYSNKVTGLLQATAPNASNPTSVTVAGKTYTIETADAAYSLSNLGPYRAGDTVTLLLGRDGAVAAVEQSSKAVGTLVGVVTQVEDQTYTDPSGSDYQAKTVTFLATDNTSYSYPVDPKASFRPGSLVQVTLTSGGEAQLARLTGSPVSGKVNSTATKIGAVPLAEDVEILDANGDGQAARVWPSRLAGMTLANKDVKYVRKNAAGEIDRLILNDATGDLYAYGILTAVREDQVLLMGSYTYDVGGTEYTYTFPNGVFSLTTGPVKLQGSLYAPEKITKLPSVKLSGLDTFTAVTDGSVSIPVAEAVTVYEQTGDVYQLSSLERVRTGYALTAYCDKLPAEGGRVRVVIARAQ